MGRQDQKMRKSGKWNRLVDRKNTKKLKAIIKKYGWPGIGLIGRADSHLAWLIAQHADHDVEFQKTCLRLMKEKRTASDPAEIAYLSDRVRVNLGKKQRYGTQFHLNRLGRLAPWPIEKRKELNKRRKQVGLEGFEKYRKDFYKDRVS